MTLLSPHPFEPYFPTVRGRYGFLTQWAIPNPEAGCARCGASRLTLIHLERPR